MNDFEVIMTELASFSEAMIEKPMIVIATKIDVAQDPDRIAALALYRRAGYAERGPFGEYASDPLSHFFEKAIDPRSKRRADGGK